MFYVFTCFQAFLNTPFIEKKMNANLLNINLFCNVLSIIDAMQENKALLTPHVRTFNCNNSLNSYLTLYYFLSHSYSSAFVVI